MLFQIISRNNDIHGNPYRLMLVYDQYGNVEACYEARSSMPNQASKLRLTHKELPGFHVSPSEYNTTKDAFRHCLVKVD